MFLVSDSYSLHPWRGIATYMPQPKLFDGSPLWGDGWSLPGECFPITVLCVSGLSLDHDALGWTTLECHRRANFLDYVVFETPEHNSFGRQQQGSSIQTAA